MTMGVGVDCECSVDYKSIISVCAGLLLITSELLALSKKTKANGIFHLILIYLEKKLRTEEPEELPETPILDEEQPLLD